MPRILASLVLAGWLSSLAAMPAAQAGPAPLPQTGDSYFIAGRKELDARLSRQPNTNPARNVILFVGDGMGMTTVTASRIFAGQLAGEDGESHELTIDRMPYSALSRTYSADAQVTDSAPSATAMTTGVKTNNDTIGLDQTVEAGVCGSGKVLRTIAEMAEDAGLATGIVSTARVTHATPAAMYAHTPNRDWEADVDEPGPSACPDIATQLVDWPAGDGFEVILGGGRANFLPATTADPKYPRLTGRRADGRDLIEAWLARYPDEAATYVWNLAGFEAADPKKTDRLLGLFEPSHMQYDVDRGDEPSLAEMTARSIDILSRNPRGYLLLVEGGRIDHAHHEGNAYRALSDTVAFDAAVQAALDKVSLDDTLVVATADHSHVFTMAGYPRRNNPILGLVRGIDGELALAEDGKPYTTLGYQNGLGSIKSPLPDTSKVATGIAALLPAFGAAGGQISRPDLTDVDTTSPDFRQQATYPLASETHGGEDVAIYAAGPFAHLFAGTVDEQFTFHVMRHALGLDH